MEEGSEKLEEGEEENAGDQSSKTMFPSRKQ